MVILDRRGFLYGLAASMAASRSFAAFAEGPQSGRKFVFVILRGAMDGLSALIPQDSVIHSVRAKLVPPEEQRLKVDRDFSLHPSFVNLSNLFHAGEAAFVHACSSEYRERSHFDGQDALERLGARDTDKGWLGRALELLPSAEGLAVNQSLPLVLNGAPLVTNWSMPVFEPASGDLLDRLQLLYAQCDDKRLAGSLEMARSMNEAAMPGGVRQRQDVHGYTDRLSVAGRLMAEPDGSGIGVVSLDGWDTHADQVRTLEIRFKAFDAGLAALKEGFGEDWKRTVVVVATEFGRTVSMNGTSGTDHGTGGLVILAGGAVKGGRVYGDWPGLGPNQLFEGRDLFPANSIISVLKTVLRDHLGVDAGDINQKIFPGSGPAMDGLIST